MAERKRRRRPSRWQRSFGGYGQRVTVWERAPAVYYARVSGCKTEFSLTARHGLRGREAAEAWARRRQADLQTGAAQVGAPTPTVERVFAAYLQYHSPTRGRVGQDIDRRCAELWRNVLGLRFDLQLYGPKRHADFVAARRAGVIDSRGNQVAPSKREPVGERTIGMDVEWLRGVCRWATTWRDTDGAPALLPANPVCVSRSRKGRRHVNAGMVLPSNRNPKRPVATEGRYRATLERAANVRMQLHRPGRDGTKGQRITTASYLPELLALANHTGRRISSILALRYDDLALQKGEHGQVRWRADEDKEGKEWWTPLNTGAREAIDAALNDFMRRLLDSPYLFPSPRNFRRSVGQDKARRWLLEAEALAGLPKLEQGCWHPYRRKWASERKHMPLQDVMWLGGWTNPACLLELYQRPDVDSLQEAADSAHPIREVLGA